MTQLEQTTTTEAELLDIITRGSADVSAARAGLEAAERYGSEAARICDGARGVLSDLLEMAEGRPRVREFLRDVLGRVIGAGIAAELATGHVQQAARALGGVTSSEPGAFSDCIARPRFGG